MLLRIINLMVCQGVNLSFRHYFKYIEMFLLFTRSSIFNSGFILLEIRQPEAFIGQLVHAGCGSAANDPAPVESGLSPAEVVHEDNDDVGLLPGYCMRRQ